MNESKTPIQNRAIETRQKIVSAAYSLFFTNGYKKTNTIIIAKKANVSVGIVYSYFKNKDELFEMWLDDLLKRCDNYFYNQFKLKSFSVELSLIVGNILEKLSDTFFSSPLVKETSPYIIKTLNSFYDKAGKIFIKACNDANVFIKNSYESIHVIISLIKSYNHDTKYRPSHINMETLKSRYVVAISSLMSQNA